MKSALRMLGALLIALPVYAGETQQSPAQQELGSAPGQQASPAPQQEVALPKMLIIKAKVKQGSKEREEESAEVIPVQQSSAIVSNESQAQMALQAAQSVQSIPIRESEQLGSEAPQGLQGLFSTAEMMALSPLDEVEATDVHPRWRFGFNVGGRNWFFGYGRRPYFGHRYLGYHRHFRPYYWPTYGYWYGNYYYPYSFSYYYLYGGYNYYYYNPYYRWPY